MNQNLDYGEIEEVLGRIMGENISFGGLVNDVTEGGNVFSPGKWMGVLGNVVLEQVRLHGQAIGYLCLLIISSAVLAVIAKAFKNKQISDMGFYMIFLLLSLIMIRSFGNCYELTESVVCNLEDFMRVLMPAYLMAAAASAYRTTAVAYYEGFLMLIYYLHKLIEVILLPAIRCYVLLSMLAFLGKEELFSRGREGLKKMILWAFRAMIAVTAGLQMIQGMISPAIDEMKHTMLSRGVSSLGSIGNVAQNVTDVIIGSGALIKNGIGVVAAVLIVAICLIPVAEVACYAFVYQVLGAVAEPISDQRLTKAISQIGEGIGLLVKLMFTVCAMFLLTIAIICVTTGGIG